MDIVDEFHAAVADNELTRLRARIADLERENSALETNCRDFNEAGLLIANQRDELARERDFWQKLCEDNSSAANKLFDRVAELEAQVAALSAEPTEDDVDDAARLIAYEMADTMGDTKAVFWSGYTFKDSARTAARAALTSFLRRRSQP